MTSPLHLPHKPRRGERFDLLVDDFDDDGEGIASVEAAIGPGKQPMRLRFHVRRAVPGDRVVAEVGSVRRRRVDAAIVELVDPSPMRIVPRCQHFVSDEHPGCGGCTFQSLDLRHQLAIKERRIKQLFARAKLDPGLVELVQPTTSDGWYYRNKMELSFANHDDGLHLGMHPAGYRYETIDQRECYLMSPTVSELVPRVRDWAASHGLQAYDGRRDSGWLRTLVVREGKRTGDRLIEIVTAHDDDSAERAPWVAAMPSIVDLFADGEATSVYWTEHRAVRGERTQFFEHLLAGAPSLREELHIRDRVLSFDIHPRSFFQTNTLGAEILYSMVVDAASPSGTDRVLDLYSGTGTIGLCLAGFCSSVLGIELVEEAVADARENAVRNGLTNAEFIAGDVGKVLDERKPQADVVVVDPPRKGLLAGALEALQSVDARRLVYVSCNPDALVPDLVALGRVGWKVARVQPVDMFPQTAHVETVVTLDR